MQYQGWNLGLTLGTKFDTLERTAMESLRNLSVVFSPTGITLEYYFWKILRKTIFPCLEPVIYQGTRDQWRAWERPMRTVQKRTEDHGTESEEHRRWQKGKWKKLKGRAVSAGLFCHRGQDVLQSEHVSVLSRKFILDNWRTQCGWNYFVPVTLANLFIDWKHKILTLSIYFKKYGTF